MDERLRAPLNQVFTEEDRKFRAGEAQVVWAGQTG
jgi:hypothetical protein